MFWRRLNGQRGTMGLGPIYIILAIVFITLFNRWMSQPGMYGPSGHWPLIWKVVGIGVPLLLFLMAIGSSSGGGFSKLDQLPLDKEPESERTKPGQEDDGSTPKGT